MELKAFRHVSEVGAEGRLATIAPKTGYGEEHARLPRGFMVCCPSNPA